MQLLFRKVTEEDGQKEYLDVNIDNAVITIGSSPRCDIQLLGMAIGAQHARLVLEDGQVKLIAEKNKSFLCDGKRLKQKILNSGDEFAIEDQSFQCVDPPTGFDLAIEWQFKPVPGHLLENAYRTSLDDLRFSLRKTSWLLVLLVFVFGGLAPLADIFWRRSSISNQSTATAVTASENTLADVGEFAENQSPTHVDNISAGVNLLGRPTADKFWLSGPMLPAHEVAVGDQCEACHQQPFVRVRDSACESCHNNIDEHLDFMHPGMKNLTAQQCSDCHKEHNEQQHIVVDNDSLCVQCHANGDLEKTVTEFSSRGHPSFAATLFEAHPNSIGALNTVEWQAVKMPVDDKLQENNHLIFPHDVHLDPQAVSHLQRGDGMLCTDCHQLNVDGEHFLAVNMEQHCSDCHDLSFDSNNPQRQLPHGESTEVFEVLKNYFVDLSFNPREASFQRRRLPGKAAVDERCIKDYDCALQQALRQAETQFLQSGCITCHEVNTVDSAEGGEQWQVLPVKLNQDWYTSARFDHKSHLTSTNQGGVSKPTASAMKNNEACLDCHRADTSSSSHDVLMPALNQCTQCHGDGSDAGFMFKPRLPLQCTACHNYHSANQYFARGVNSVVE